MQGLTLLLAVACLTLGPAMAQITFSRSWVPQGKRSSSPAGSVLAQGEIGDSCQEAKLAVLSQVANYVTRLMEETSELPSDEASLAYHLRQAQIARRRRMA
ncbi:uncharacterized protein [Palaemon carinicauda]|uniref:uncharacterized protein n=1 Tax=Palaemon carinicauda TaxID=392227 RepID=UPI0035B5C22E